MDPGEHSGPVQECCVRGGKDKEKLNPYLDAQRMLVSKHQLFLKPYL